MTHPKYNPFEICTSLNFAIKMGYLKGLLLDILAESRHLLYLLLSFFRLYTRYILNKMHFSQPSLEFTIATL